MKDYSICDDILMARINEELAHIGCFMPISLIEKTAIRAYDLTSKAQCKLLKGSRVNISLNKNNKNELYYELLTNLVCIELIANARLAKARNKYEVNSVLSLLQGYLTALSRLCKSPEYLAVEVFSEILDELDYKVAVFKIADECSAPEFEASDFPTEVANHIDSILSVLPKKTNDIKNRKPNTKTSSHICSNQIANEQFRQCDCNACDDMCEDCDEVMLTLSYRGLCFGVKVDPIILMLNQPLDETNIKDKTMVFKKFITKASNELRKKAKTIYTILWQHSND